MNGWSQASAERRILSLGAAVFLLDQLTKLVVVQSLRLGEERAVLPGFFTFVHWGNTGSAWSLFRGNNHLLAGVAVIALVGLWWGRRQFEAHRLPGQLALGFLFGGIVGNLLDRILPGRRHVVDFLYFHLHPREGGELGFPAFNVADMAICTGVGLLILLSWSLPPDRPAPPPVESPAGPGNPDAR
ncbi:MAG: signal peptidase II [Verrucomicrobiota bacterium]